MPQQRLFVLTLAGIEGASVLSLEIFAGQLLTPAFGDSVFKWLCVLIASMVGLTIGYCAAPRWGQRARGVRLPMALLLAGLTYEVSLSLWFDGVLTRLIGFPGTLPIVVASISIVLVPMVLFGMVPGLLVELSAQDDRNVPNAGRVFAASTIGGMLGGLAAGTCLIPAVGVTLAIQYAVGVLMIPLVFSSLRTRARSEVACVLCVWAAVLFLPQERFEPTGGGKLLDYKEGMLGQVAVVETIVNKTERQRVLYVNRMSQSVYVDSWLISLHHIPSYIRRSLPILASYPKKSSALLLGLGGATFVHVARQLEFDVTVVELDQRIIDFAQRYFDAPRDAEYVLDDARRYIRRSGRTFDILFFDVYRGEYPPTHLITLESLRELNQALRPHGVVMINVAGRIDSLESETVRSLIKTIRAAGFRCRILQEQHSQNTLLVLDRGDREVSEALDPTAIQRWGGEMALEIFDDSVVSYENAYVLTDDRPILEALYRSDARKFRSAINAPYLDRRYRELIPLFR